jgi:hypothetical protein
VAQYKQVKSFSFTGKLIFKEENLLKTKDGSSWRRLQFGITDGVTTQYVEVSEFGAGRDFETQVNKTSGDGFEKEIISWSDRHNPKVICTNEFLTRLDFPHQRHRQLEFLLGFIPSPFKARGDHSPLFYLLKFR